MVVQDIQVIYSVLWIALMLIYLLGDVVRIFAGDFEAGEMEGSKVSSKMYLLAAGMMVIPIIMVVLNIFFISGVMKWTNIVVSGFFLLFNIAGLKGYKIYDQFLLVISFVVNIIIIYIAFTG